MCPLSANEIRSTNDEVFQVNIEKMKEVFVYRDINDLFKEKYRGYYPELYKQRMLPVQKYYSDYVNTYIDRDIAEIINVKDKLKFHNFMQILASLTAQQLNYASLSKEVEVSTVTIKEWLSVMITSGIVYLLQPYNDSSVNHPHLRR